MLSARLNDTYQFIRRYILQNGVAPTEKEISEGINITSRGTVHRYVHALAKAGFLSILKNKKRNIELILEKDLIISSVLLTGEITKNNTIKNIKSNVSLDLFDFVRNPSCYVLQVTDCLFEDGYFKLNDFVICERYDSDEISDKTYLLSIDDKNLILATVSNTCHRNTVKVTPINTSLDSIICYRTAIKIEAVYVGMIRKP